MCSGMVWHLPPGQGQAFCDTRQPISSIAGATKWAIPMITEEASDAGSRGFWQARIRLKPGAKLLFRLLLSTLWISKTRLYTCWFRNGYSFEISKWFFLKLEINLHNKITNTDITFLVFKVFSRSAESHGQDFAVGMWALRDHCTDKHWKTLSWGSRYFKNIIKLNSLLFLYLKMKELSGLDQCARNGEWQEAGAGCGNEQKAVGLKKYSWVSTSFFWATEELALQGLKQGRCDCVCVFMSKSSCHHFLIRTKTLQKAWCHSKERLGDSLSLIQGYKILGWLDKDWPPVWMSSSSTLLSECSQSRLNKGKFQCKMADTAHMTNDNDEMTA